MDAVGADRAEQRVGEAAVAAAAHDQHVGACRLLDKDLGRVPLEHPGLQPGRANGAEDLVQGVGEGFLGQHGQVEVVRVGRHPAVERRILPGDDDLQGGAGELGLPGSPAQRRLGAFRPVDAHDDAGRRAAA